jgi:hypothetical protein
VKINRENMQDIFHFGLKILCDGYVTEQQIKAFSFLNFLFDWKNSCTIKKVVKHLFSRTCLFDGYLTEN